MKQTNKWQRGCGSVVNGLVVLVTLLGMGGMAVEAQEEGEPKRGFHSAGSYALSDIESVSMTSGNLSFSIPLGVLPPGRGGLSGKINLLYNSKQTDSYPHWTTYTQGSTEHLLQQNILTISNAGGWVYGVEYSLQEIDRMAQYNEIENVTIGGNPTPQCPNDQRAIKRHKLKIMFPDGSSHEMKPAGYDDYQDDGYYGVTYTGFVENCSAGSWLENTKLTYYSVDGSFLRLEIDLNATHGVDDPWTLYFPDGSRYTSGNWPNNQPPRFYDRNDNYFEIINAQYNGHECVKLRDAFSREVILEFNSATDEDSVHQPGVGGTLTTRIKRTTVLVSRTYYTSDTENPYDPFLANWGHSHFLVEEVILPTNLEYQFTYNASTSGWGEVKSITLPSGDATYPAIATYQYKLDPAVFGNDPPKWSDVIQEQSPTQRVLSYTDQLTGSQVTEPATTYNIEPQAGSSTVTAPDGGLVTEYFAPTSSGLWNKGLVYKTVHPDGTIVERVWKQNFPDGFSEGGAPTNNVNAANPYVKTEYITKAANPYSPQSTDKTVVKDRAIDKNGNVLENNEYDWVDFGAVHSGGSPSGLPSSTYLKRVTVSAYHADTPEASNSYTGASAYNKTTAPRVVRLIKSGEIRSGTSSSTALTRSEFEYDNTATNGNLTVERSWDSTKGTLTRPLSSGTFVKKEHVYGSYGNKLRTFDPKNTQTEFTYDGNGLYVIKTEVAYGEAVKRTTENQYDQSTGLVILAKDTDNDVTTTTTYDVYGRPTLIEEADGLQMERQTTKEYSDSLRRVITRSDLRTTGDQKVVSVQHYDQMGRISLVRSLEPGDSATDASQGIKVQARYAYSGTNRYELKSNPYRTSTPTSEGSMGWTLTKFDQGGRIIEVKTYSGATPPAPFGAGTSSTGTVGTSYGLTTTTVTDHANKTRESSVDGLGRLIKVRENPSGLNYETTYTYSSAGNLLTVVQGDQTRTFVYDSLSRLSSATMPEYSTSGSGYGSISYQYDDNANLTKRTDALQVVTDYTYDKLNRVKTREYSTQSGNSIAIAAAAASPIVTHYYGNETLPSGGPAGFSRGSAAGRLVAVTYGGSSALTGSFYGYDAAGRVVTSVQATSSEGGGQHTYPAFSYEYTVSGQLKKETYPTGRVLENTFDDAGRVGEVKGTSGETTTTYTHQYTYTPHGAVEQYQMGNALWSHTKFNSRLQVARIGLGTSSDMESAGAVSGVKLEYGYGTTSNNGNLLTQEVTIPTSPTATVISQEYSYDALNRIEWYKEGGTTQQSYGYDRYGNRWITSSPVPELIPTAQSHYTATTNRINLSSHPYGYDYNGNIVSMPQNPLNPQDRILNYDGENRVVSTNLGGGSLDYYFYDGEGHRIRKKVGGVETMFLYDASGRLAAEYSLTPPEPAIDGTRYLTVDHLGSTRVLTDGTASVKARYDYKPFGEELAAGMGVRTTAMGYSSTESLRQQFTSKERDSETGLDYFYARYFSSNQGRFISVDPGVSTLASPQSWNRYPYVENNPLKFVDPTGRELILKGEEAEALLGYLRTHSGLNLLLDSKSGKIKKGKGKRTEDGTSEALAKIISEAINAKEKIEIRVTANEPASNFVDDYKVRTADFADIRVLDDQAPQLGRAFVGHFLREYVGLSQGAHFDDLQVVGTTRVIEGAHTMGLKAESTILSEFTGQKEMLRKTKDENPVFTFSYSSIEFEVILKSVKNARGEDATTIDKITTKSLPTEKRK